MEFETLFTFLPVLGHVYLLVFERFSLDALFLNSEPARTFASAIVITSIIFGWGLLTLNNFAQVLALLKGYIY